MDQCKEYCGYMDTKNDLQGLHCLAQTLHEAEPGLSVKSALNWQAQWFPNVGANS